MTVIFKFMCDQTQTPNSKVKVATMNHLRGLAQLMEPAEVAAMSVSSHEQEMALGKIITWTVEPKSAEVRKSAIASLVSLFRLNAAHFSAVLHKLPKMYQDNAADLVADFIMSASTSTLTESTASLSTTTTTAMKPLNPAENNSSSSAGLNKRRDSKDNNNKDPVDDSENLNPEEVHKSLRSTANAIQNYSFEGKQEQQNSSSTGVGSSLPDGLVNNANNSSGSKIDDLPSLADKMSLLDIGSKPEETGSGEQQTVVTGNGTSKLGLGDAPPPLAKRGSLVTKISIENSNNGKTNYYDRSTDILVEVIKYLVPPNNFEFNPNCSVHDAYRSLPRNKSVKTSLLQDHYCTLPKRHGRRSVSSSASSSSENKLTKKHSRKSVSPSVLMRQISGKSLLQMLNV